jgi:hypothetical protein
MLQTIKSSISTRSIGKENKTEELGQNTSKINLVGKNLCLSDKIFQRNKIDIFLIEYLIFINNRFFPDAT